MFIHFQGLVTGNIFIIYFPLSVGSIFFLIIVILLDGKSKRDTIFGLINYSKLYDLNTVADQSGLSIKKVIWYTNGFISSGKLPGRIDHSSNLFEPISAITASQTTRTNLTTSKPLIRSRDSEQKVFVSHSTTDTDITNQLVNWLEGWGVKCWVAPRDIAPGERWNKAIVLGLDACNTMILLLSSHSNDSKQVSRELELSDKRNMKIIPVRIENVDPSSDMEYFLSQAQWLDAFPTLEDHHMQKILDQVK